MAGWEWRCFDDAFSARPAHRSPDSQRGRTMTYTVWLHGQQIGETEFEFRPDRRRQAGTFHPTEFGLTVLPSITEMMPALFDFGDLCRRHGLDTEDTNSDSASDALDRLAATPEAERLMAVAKRVSRVEVRDADGQLVVWDSLLISDLELLVQIARERTPSVEEELDEPLHHDPIKFMISLTLKEETRRMRRPSVLAN